MAILEARRLKVNIINVVREYWEVVILKGLFESIYGKFLVFKGGTALRLVYGSPRFSEDLDFSLLRDTLKKRFCPLVERIISPYPELSITDCVEKYYTYLAEIRVSINYLSTPFRIKIEISKRIQRGYKWELKLLSSPSVNLQALVQVATLRQLYKDKLICAKERLKSKDIFDLWYLSQRLNLPYNPKEVLLPKTILRRDLRKYLPKGFWRVIERLKE